MLGRRKGVSLSDHKQAIVPLESWAYASPELKLNGKETDIGLVAEAMIYYDTVIVNPTTPVQLAELIKWIIDDGGIRVLFSLLNEGKLKIYDFAFLTAAIEKDGSYSIWNIQDPIQSQENTFERRYLYHKAIEAVVPKSRNREQLYRNFKGCVIESKSDGFGKAVENARSDFSNPHRNAILIQAFVDELYRIRGIPTPPEVKAKISTTTDGSKHHIEFNTSFPELSVMAGKELNFHKGSPLTASAHSNRFVWAAATTGCDLYLPKPISVLVGDKLYESKERVAKSGSVIEELKLKVEFPNIRTLVNSGALGIDDVLKMRKKAKKFRRWLQQESERDRDAIIAYHNEVVQEMGILKAGRKALSIFGVLGGGAAGSVIGTSIAGPVGGAVGGAAGGAIGYLTDVCSRIGADWKPVVFGNWMRNRIEKHIEGDKEA